jgi:hypothetical protein
MKRSLTLVALLVLTATGCANRPGSRTPSNPLATSNQNPPPSPISDSPYDEPVAPGGYKLPVTASESLLQEAEHASTDRRRFVSSKDAGALRVVRDFDGASGIEIVTVENLRVFVKDPVVPNVLLEHDIKLSAYRGERHVNIDVIWQPASDEQARCTTLNLEGINGFSQKLSGQHRREQEASPDGPAATPVEVATLSIEAPRDGLLPVAQSKRISADLCGKRFTLSDDQADVLLSYLYCLGGVQHCPTDEEGME